MKFPLPQGHMFGLSLSGDLRVHDGSNFRDGEALAEWQRQVNLTVDRDQPVTFRFDGPTQRNAVRLQLAHGLSATAFVDEATWKAAFEVGSAELDEPTGPPADSTTGSPSKASESDAEPPFAHLVPAGLPEPVAATSEGFLPRVALPVNRPTTPNTPKRGRPPTKR